MKPVPGVTAFFYGTLMHPSILKRVIKNDGSHLKLCPAILLDFTRHRVKYADYPGIVHCIKSESLFKRELTREEKSVRGMLVSGLTSDDMHLLDLFEGDQYVKREVSVRPLEKFQDISAHFVDEEATVSSFPDTVEELSSFPAQTYVFADEHDLVPELWSYDQFVRESARKWY